MAGVILLAPGADPLGAVLLRQVRYQATLPRTVGSTADAELPEITSEAGQIKAPRCCSTTAPQARSRTAGSEANGCAPRRRCNVRAALVFMLSGPYPGVRRADRSTAYPGDEAGPASPHGGGALIFYTGRFDKAAPLPPTT